MDISNYITFDLRVPYKKLLLYPVLVKDYMTFSYASTCLQIDKNSIPIPEVIMMSELEFMFYCTQMDASTPYILLLDRLLGLCLRDDKSFEDAQSSVLRFKPHGSQGKPVFIIADEEYTAEDFKEIKKIIVAQNDIELPDENISKEVRDSLDEARRYKQKMHGKPASLEDYLVSVAVTTGWTLDYIYTMPIRKFQRVMKRLDNYIHYKIYLAASMSGMAQFSDTSMIKHWLSNLDATDKYGDVSVGLDKIQDTISLESAKR